MSQRKYEYKKDLLIYFILLSIPVLLYQPYEIKYPISPSEDIWHYMEEYGSYFYPPEYSVGVDHTQLILNLWAVFLISLVLSFSYPFYTNYLIRKEYKYYQSEWKNYSSCEAANYFGDMYSGNNKSEAEERALKSKGISSFDYSEAFDWYTKANSCPQPEEIYSRAHIESTYRLARLYERGDGCKKDQKIAIELYIEAAKSGHCKAALSIFRIERGLRFLIRES